VGARGPHSGSLAERVRAAISELRGGKRRSENGGRFDCVRGIEMARFMKVVSLAAMRMNSILRTGGRG
jgi:hypothetical protein